MRSGHPHRATLSDIAKRAGVSVSTASLVLSDKAKERRISDSVSARVRQAALALDYTPNLLVQSLQRGRTQILSFYNGFRNRNQDDLYMDRLSTAIEQAGGRQGYDILVHCDFRRTPEESYRHLNGGHTDGLLFLAPMLNDALLPFLRASRLPVVLINGAMEDSAFSSVRDDVEDGMSQVAERLVEYGHRRVALLTCAPWNNPDAFRRVALLRDALAGKGVTVPERWIIPTHGLTETDVRQVLQTLFAEPDPPTAMFCWHDRLGYQVLEQCEVLGIRVPTQLSLVGYDGLHWPATTRHLLASVRVDLEALADGAVALLDDLIQERQTGPTQRVLPVTLIEGTTLTVAAR